MTGEEVLRSTRSILLVDFPSTEVPDALTRAGFAVTAHGGPGPQDYFAFELDGHDVREVRIGQAPERVDLVYVHRPLGEFPAILSHALALDAKAVWCESGSEEARTAAEAAGLIYVDQPSIAVAARAVIKGR